MKRIFYILFCAAMLSACGSSDSFEISGTVEGLGTQNLRIIYSDGNAIHNLTSTAVDSKFRFEGNSKQETVVEIYNNIKVLLGRVVVRNGESLNLTLQRDDPSKIKVSGNSTSEALVNFINKNAANLNDVIAAQVADKPGEMLSAVLLNYYYDVAANPAQADSLLALLDYAALPSTIPTGLSNLITRIAHAPDSIGTLRFYSPADSLARITPADTGRTLLYFAEYKEIPDTIVERFDSVATRYSRLVYILMNADTAGWRAGVSSLPKGVKTFWAPFGLADTTLTPLAIPQLPYAITISPKGEILSRGIGIAD